MTRLGYTLSSEEHPPRELVENAVRAESLGVDFCSISDHFHPWTTNQGHAPFVWSVLGAVASRTETMGLAVGVTCPIIRIHPAVLAQAAATVSLLAEGRFHLGVGTGENLNEHVLGDRWPIPEDRRAMLREAVEVMRRLWSGETVDHRGEHYVVENARLFDPPVEELPVIVSGFGPAAVDLAAEIGDGLWSNMGGTDLVERYEEGGGTGPRYCQVNVCLGDDEERCRRTVHDIWPNSALPGQLAQDLPTWTHVEQVAELLDPEAAAATVPCGPDLGSAIEKARTAVEAGFDHVYLHQIGPDQRALFSRWSELRDGILA